ncbi:MAG: DUF975 family protein [Oscillospiraceae bacterium]|nr:DUF975 family protein [Oscillospiraceae bacterium]
MIRAELKAKAKSQIKGNIGILFLIYLVYSLIFSAVFAPFIAMMTAPIVNLFAITATPELASVGLADLGVWYWIGFAGTMIVGLIAPAFMLGWTKIFLGLTNNQKPKVADLFSGFKSFGKALWLYILWGFFIFLWTLPFHLPAIILLAVIPVLNSQALVVVFAILGILLSIAALVMVVIKLLAYWQSFYILAENPHMTARECLRESVSIMRGNKGKLFVLELSFIGWFLLGMITLGIAFIWIGPYFYTTLANFYHAVKGKSASQPSFANAAPAPVAPEVEVEVELDIEE